MIDIIVRIVLSHIEFSFRKTYRHMKIPLMR